MTTFPSCITESEICDFCNTAQDPGSCNNGSEAAPCSAYCNVGCNTICDSCQTMCEYDQLISHHPDVGDYPLGEVYKNQTIQLKWSKKFWNDLEKQLDTAEKVGKTKAQGSGGTVTYDSNNIIRASLYNDMVKKINHFNVNLSRVKVDDIIYATTANALRTGYKAATFNTTVCDICNTGDQHVRGTCGCNCPCSCSCSCTCPCPCPCPCDNPDSGGGGN